LELNGFSLKARKLDEKEAFFKIVITPNLVLSIYYNWIFHGIYEKFKICI